MVLRHETMRAGALFAYEMTGDPSRVRHTAMLPKVNALPCAEYEASANERNRNLGGAERRPDMGGHVIRTLIAMPEKRIAVGYETG